MTPAARDIDRSGMDALVVLRGLPVASGSSFRGRAVEPGIRSVDLRRIVAWGGQRLDSFLAANLWIPGSAARPRNDGRWRAETGSGPECRRIARGQDKMPLE
jgi:hypothetical protein